MNEEESWKQKYEEVTEEYEETKEQLVKAAEFGKNLIEETKNLKKQLGKMSDDYDKKEKEVEMLEAKLMDAAQRVMYMENEKNDKASEELSQLQEELKSAKSRNTLLTKQLNDAEVNYKSLLEDLKRKEDLLSHKDSDYKKLIERMASEADELRKRVQSLKEELQSALEKSEEQHVVHQTLVKKYEELEEDHSIANKKLEDTLSELQGLLQAGGNASDKREEMLKKEVVELVAEVESMSEKYNATKQNKDKLEEMVQILIKENQKLLSKTEEQQQVISEARENLRELREAQEKHESTQKDFSDPLGANGKNINDNNEERKFMRSSLLEQLESKFAEVQKDIPESCNSIQGSSSQKDRSSDLSAPNNCEEYFIISSTAVKVKLAIKFPHKSDEVFKIKGSALYNDAMKEGIPFHEWYSWLEERLAKKLMEIDTPIITQKNQILVVAPNKKNTKTETIKKKWATFWKRDN